MSTFTPFYLYDKLINDVTVLSVLFYACWFKKVHLIKYSLPFLYENLIILQFYIFFHIIVTNTQQVWARHSLYFWFPSDRRRSEFQKPEEGRVREPLQCFQFFPFDSACLSSRNRDPPRHHPRGPRWHRPPPPPPPLTATAIVSNRWRYLRRRRHRRWPLPP